MQYDAYLARPKPPIQPDPPAVIKPVAPASLPVTPSAPTPPTPSPARTRRPGAGRKTHGRLPYLIRLKPATMDTLRAKAQAIGAKAVGEVIELQNDITIPK